MNASQLWLMNVKDVFNIAAADDARNSFYFFIISTPILMAFIGVANTQGPQKKGIPCSSTNFNFRWSRITLKSTFDGLHWTWIWKIVIILISFSGINTNTFDILQAINLLGSGCGAVGRAVTSDTREPGFESSRWQLLFTVNCL